MGLAELFLGKENPFSQYVADNKNTVHGAFAGLSQGNSFASGLGGAAMGANRGAVMDDLAQQQKAEEEKRQAMIVQYAGLVREMGPEYDAFAKAIELGGIDPSDAWLQAHQMKQSQGQEAAELERSRANAQFITDPQLRSMVEAGALPFSEAYKYQTQGGADPRNIGLQPQWATDPATGKPVLGQLADDGTFVPTEMGGLEPMDPSQLYTQRAFGNALGGSQGEAAAAAPSDVVAAQTALDLVQSIRDDPELPWATGTSAGLGANMVPGTGRFGFQAKVDQAKSGAFLTAIQEMRGMGALSNAEGQTATQAVTRMNTALSKEDFEAALDDYEFIVSQGMQRAQQRMTAAPGSFPADLSPAQGGGMPTAVNPATGERMVFDGQQWVPAQ